MTYCIHERRTPCRIVSLPSVRFCGSRFPKKEWSHFRPLFHRQCLHNNASRKLKPVIEITGSIYQINGFQQVLSVNWVIWPAFDIHSNGYLMRVMNLNSIFTLFYFIRSIKEFLVHKLLAIFVRFIKDRIIKWKPNSRFLDFPRASTWFPPLRFPRTNSNSYVPVPQNWTATLNW